MCVWKTIRELFIIYRSFISNLKVTIKFLYLNSNLGWSHPREEAWQLACLVWAVAGRWVCPGAGRGGTPGSTVPREDTPRNQVHTLQIVGWRESNTNIWFPFMSSQKRNSYFQNRIIMFCLPVPTLIYPWEICIFPGSVCLFCCRKICEPILGIYKSLTDSWIWKLGLRPRNSQKMNT